METILSLETNTTLFYAIFMISSSSPSRLRHFTETYPEVDDKITCQYQEKRYFVVKFIISVGLVLLNGLDVCVFKGLHKKKSYIMEVVFDE